MKWDTSRTRFNRKLTAVRVWHKWFAWRPVAVYDKVVWLETVCRKGTKQYYTDDIEYTYKPLSELNDGQ